MADYENISDLVLRTVQLIVDYPDEVAVEAVHGDICTTFRIRVNSADVGKVIGRQGRTAESLRILAGGMATILHWSFLIEIHQDRE
jgi:predicted RNA-binding protein YlqC (UPF0109 family)